MGSFKEIYSIAQEGENTKLFVFMMVLTVSVFFSFVLSGLYVYFAKKRFVNDINLYKLYPLLALSTTSIFASLQFSIPLSLGLLGSLSIVRFRTPIKDPLEIGFILLVLASSLLAATANFSLLIAVIVISTIVLYIIHRDPFGLLNNDSGNGVLMVILSKEDQRTREKEIHDIFSRKKLDGEIDSMTEQGNIFTLVFRFRKLELEDLREIKEKLGPNAEYNIYYAKEGVVR
jgi:hypothetical protein